MSEDHSDGPGPTTDPVGPRDQTVLVTGGAGFIGSHLVSALLEENDVVVLDDGSAGDRSTVPGGARGFRPPKYSRPGGTPRN